MSHRKPVSSWRLVLPLLLVVVSGCAHRGAPTAYPEFDPTTARPSLVIAEFIATGDLPNFDECRMPEVLCMDPAPTWIHARTLQTVYGESPGKTFYASTTSHYGRIDAYARPETMLMVLLTRDGASVMSRYARGALKADSSGRWHLVLNDAGPHWLPCSVRGLREAITDPTLVRISAFPREQYEQFYAEKHAEYFRLEGETAHPRYSLPLARIQEHLAGKTLSAGDFVCVG
jgi:hypothetical protein